MWARRDNEPLSIQTFANGSFLHRKAFTTFIKSLSFPAIVSSSHSKLSISPLDHRQSYGIKVIPSEFLSDFPSVLSRRVQFFFLRTPVSLSNFCEAPYFVAELLRIIKPMIFNKLFWALWAIIALFSPKIVKWLTFVTKKFEPRQFFFELGPWKLYLEPQSPQGTKVSPSKLWWFSAYRILLTIREPLGPRAKLRDQKLALLSPKNPFENQRSTPLGQMQNIRKKS